VLGVLAELAGQIGSIYGRVLWVFLARLGVDSVGRGMDSEGGALEI
jgi:hypothetical protein